MLQQEIEWSVALGEYCRFVTTQQPSKQRWFLPVGTSVAVQAGDVVQVVDDAEGPTTKREYELTSVPVGAALCGQVVDFLGCPRGSQYQLGMNAQLPLLNDQLDMKSREQINTALFTGVKVYPAC